jgi:hypothetical protein
MIDRDLTVSRPQENARGGRFAPTGSQLLN